MRNPLTSSQWELLHPGLLPRHYHPGYAFIFRDGYYQARKIGLTAKQVQVDPRFHKTRRLSAEFGRMAVYAKLIRTAFCAGTAIKCKPERLLSPLLRALQYDQEHLMGTRMLSSGHLEELEGFNFNEQAVWEQVCTIPIDHNESPDMAHTILRLPAFVPIYFIHPPPGIDACRIYLQVVMIDPGKKVFRSSTSKTTIIPLKKIHVPAITLTVQHHREQGELAVTAIGVQWYASSKGTALTPAAIAGPLMIIGCW